MRNDGTPLQTHRSGDWLVIEDNYAEHPLKISDRFIQEYADFDLLTETIVNTFNQNQIDTLFILSKATDSLKVLSFKGARVVTALDISTERIILDRGISLGMRKEVFFKKFSQLDRIALKPDKIRIWYFASSIEFTFTQDSLSKISWQVGEMD